MRTAGEKMSEVCYNSRHGMQFWQLVAGNGPLYANDEFDPDCQSCSMRATLAEHSHLHLDGAKCETPGINGKPGVNVKCSCGSFHH